MPLLDSISTTTIFSLSIMMMAAGLMYSRFISVGMALMVMVGGALFYSLRDSVGPRLIYIIPVLFVLGITFWFISTLPRGQRRFSYRLLIVVAVAAFAYGIYVYINVLSMVLLFSGLIALLLGGLLLI